MMRRTFLLIAVLALGCREAAEVVEDDVPPPAVSTDFARLPDVLAGIQAGGKLALYEGLPSIFWEPQLREQELNRQETLDIHGHAVYDNPLRPSAADVGQLTSLLSARESYQPYNSRKKCGGFSADYGIEWTTGEATTHVLVSLECGEVQIFSPHSELYCDVTADVGQKLKQLLTAYRKNAPTSNPP
jgi:hypothetical protein